jgi:hypothetical protein
MTDKGVLAVAGVIVALGFGVLLVGCGGEDETRAPGGAAVEAPEPLVDPSEIVSGGPPPDGIPPIDEPEFQPRNEVTWLDEQEPVIVVQIGEDTRAYPLQIMTWHEIVNDEVGGKPISVTFCPLCNTAYAFVRPEVDGDITTFGTSGKLYNSNLVMYDRATESYWPQAWGKAVMGPLTGTELDRVPAQIVSWGDFRSAFPEGLVLSRDTGHQRDYGSNPYPGYDDIDNPPFLFDGEVDGRLTAVERVLGVEAGDHVVAFPYFRLRESAQGPWAAVNSEVGEEPVVVVWKAGTVSALDSETIAQSRDVGAAAAFSRAIDGRTLTFRAAESGVMDEETGSTWTLLGKAIRGPLAGQELQAMDAHDSFWFDWAAFHPETELWSGG